MRNSLKKSLMPGLRHPISSSVIHRVISTLERSLWKIILNMSKSMRKMVFLKTNGSEKFNKSRISSPKMNPLLSNSDLLRKGSRKGSTPSEG